MNIFSDDSYLVISYSVDLILNKRNIKKNYHLTLRRFIDYNNETFEVLGLLKAEMGKTDNGCVNFSNCEPRIINKVLEWFDKEIEISPKKWKWYIKVNMKEPEDKKYRLEIENKLKKYWLEKTNINYESKYPLSVSYKNDSIHEKLNICNKGTLVIEFKSNLFSQIIKNYVEKFSLEVLNLGEEEIRNFMRGVIAGEGCISFNKKEGNFRVLISSTKKDERDLYQDCLKRLNIESCNYDDSKDIKISKKENVIKLYSQRLICLHLARYNKFLTMIHSYKNKEGLFEQTKPWNKTSSEKEKQIIDLSAKNPHITSKEIATEGDISPITANRIMRRNKLGKRSFPITPKEKRLEIVKFIEENPSKTLKKISIIFNVHESVVNRINRKFNKFRGNKARCKIPEEKTNKILEMYKENPAIKFSDISKEVGVSHSVIKRVRRENNMEHLGYKHLIGCNKK